MSESSPAYGLPRGTWAATRYTLTHAGRAALAAIPAAPRRGGYTDAEIAAGNGPRGGAPRGADRERRG